MLLTCQQDLDEALERLLMQDRRLLAVRKVASSPIALRKREQGLKGLIAIVLAQQVSVASARAIAARFYEAFPACKAQDLVESEDEGLRALSLSRPKVRTVKALAKAVLDGFDFNALATMPVDEAHEQLCALHGVGPWTAQIYLLFCLGHGDVFPAGDLALQIAVGKALGLDEKPDAVFVAELAKAHWAPERSAAAHLFWAYYHAIKSGRDGVV
ncbi:MAG: DNA-3-methyladenine glycosylase 2 family protein [Cohaesibacter sp.]|nr:DNA-3-methyladenine glycosylase 2 family protein [Cohaesibacter sp.]